ncbi:MAG: MMPL family transporter, partial [Desulfobacteraceae bacterium]|nr:MMPL family transporter [Desulfobacteraceae bacterium]
MAKLRKTIESLFESLANYLYTHKFSMLFMVIIIVILFASQIPNIKIDTSTEGFLHIDDPILLDYEEFRDQFGREEIAMVSLKPGKIFDPTFLKKLKSLHDDLEENLPFLDDITSLINARNTHGSKDELIVEDLFETWPDSEKTLSEIEKRARSNEMYKNLLLSEDGLYTNIVIKTQTYSQTNQASTDDLDGFSDEPESESESDQSTSKVYLTDQENSEFIKALENIVNRHRSPDIKMYIAGTPIVTDFLKRSMMSDMGKFMKIVLATIAVFLFITFRRFSGVVMPIIIVIVSLLSTIGLMAIAGIAIKVPTQILPSFLLSVAVGASVHVLVIFFQHFDQNGSKKDAIAYALGHSGLPILMTSLTTAGGLMSFSTAAVAPIAELGLFASAGVLLSLFYTIVLLPVLLAIIPLKPKHIKTDSDIEPDKSNPGIMDKVLNFSVKTSTTHPVLVLVVFSFALIIAVSGIHKIRLS